MEMLVLKQGDFLAIGDALVSENGEYRLEYKKSGQLELTDERGTVSWKNELKQEGAWRTYFDENGDLISYRRANSPTWKFVRGSKEIGDELVLANDGKLVIKHQNRGVEHINLQRPMLKSMGEMMPQSSSSQDKYPLDFKLKDLEGNNLLSINDNDDNVLILELINKGTETINLTQQKGVNRKDIATASKDNYHFKLDFRSGTFRENLLALEEHNEINLKNWDLNVNEVDYETNPENIFSVYLLCKNKFTILPNEKIRFYFGNANASEHQGARKTRVLFTCKSLQYGRLNLDEYTKEKHLNIVYQKGERNLPVNAGFLNTNRVINDGKTDNSLIFHVKNSEENDYLLMNTKAANAPVSSFVIEFTVSDVNINRAVKNRALAKKDFVNGISIEIHNKYGECISSTDETNSWIIKKNDQHDVPIWEITYSSNDRHVNKNGQFNFKEMVIVIHSIKTDGPSGQTAMTLRHKNIPSYWDGAFIREIELIPIGIKDKKVGIGTNNPQVELEVKGVIRSDNIQDAYGDLLPTGSIIMWYGEEASVPFGWKICNGEHNTPDLRNRFIVGAGNDYLHGDQGGKREVTLTENEMPKHEHEMPKHEHEQRTFLSKDDEKNATTSYVASTQKSSEYLVSTAGESQAHENRPPYYALYFIMKK